MNSQHRDNPLYLPVIVIAQFFCTSLWFAGNAISRAAGISDGMLLGLMLGFIVLLLIIIQALSKSIEGIARSSVKNKPNSNKAKAVIAFILLSSAAELSA